MQRDIDLVRQLLMDLERGGAASPLEPLRAESRHDVDEQIRYHVRLLTDAGLVEDAGQTSAGAPCVRLTHDGHEFIELARSDARWRDAKAAVLAATGGQPLTVLRGLLTKWAWRAVVRNERRRVARGRRYRHYVEPVQPDLWLDAYGADPDELWDDDQARVVRERAEYRERQRIPNGWEPDLYSDVAAELAATTARAPSLGDGRRCPPPSAALPEHLI